MEIDHTKEIEQRISALYVGPYDKCIFFAIKENVLSGIRACKYCIYGKFSQGEVAPGERGVCKYKSFGR